MRVLRRRPLAAVVRIRRLVCTVVADLELVGGRVLEHRTGISAGTNVEDVRRRAHDQVDAYLFALAANVPIGPELEYPDPPQGGMLCVATSDAGRLADLMAGASAITYQDATLLSELEGQLRVQIAGRRGVAP